MLCCCSCCCCRCIRSWGRCCCRRRLRRRRRSVIRCNCQICSAGPIVRSLALIMPTFNFVRFVVRPTERPSDPLLPYLPAHGHCAPDSAKILAQSRQSRSGQTGPHCVRRFIGAPFRCNSFFSAFLGPKQLAGGRKAARSWAPNQRLLLLLLLFLLLLHTCHSSSSHSSSRASWLQQLQVAGCNCAGVRVGQSASESG